jgi:hypothetical protein
VPNIDNDKFPHTRPWQSKGEHAKLYTFSPTDYNNLGGIWSGTADWADGAPLQVIQGIPSGTADAPEGTPNQAGFSPNHDPRKCSTSPNV